MVLITGRIIDLQIPILAVNIPLGIGVQLPRRYIRQVGRLRWKACEKCCDDFVCLWIRGSGDTLLEQRHPDITVHKAGFSHKLETGGKEKLVFDERAGKVKTELVASRRMQRTYVKERPGVESTVLVRLIPGAVKIAARPAGLDNDDLSKRCA